ncbi:MAG: hypothetical protein LBR76_02575 [Oscillospiraceae bacterium]|jgi:hypothetical protein|nr:hypothetical protein [Oscillospiraceae bacterium]
MKRFLCIMLALALAAPFVSAAEEETDPAIPEEGAGPGAFSVIQTESSVVIIPENPDTVFEFAVVTALEQVSPDWTLAGSARERGGSEVVARFPPRGVPYEIWVRVQDSEEIEKRTGFIAYTPALMLDLEVIGPFSGDSEGTTWYISYDGGNKWTEEYADPDTDLYIDLSKKIGKKELHYVIKQAETEETEEGTVLTEPAKSATVLEGKIKPRPALGKEYSVKAFISEQLPENWTLTGGKAALEYSSNGGASWSPFSYETGLPLLTVAEQAAKQKAISYQFRIAANEASKVPASKPRKYTQVKQLKAPTVKPDYKRETIKIKDGMRYAFAEAGADVRTLTYKNAGGDPVSIEEALTERQTVYIYIPENGKKSRSAYQTMTLAPRGIAPDEAEGLIAKKSSAGVQKGFEYYGSKEKWGSFTKGDTEGLVRRKATAKYNAKTNVNTGYAASRPVKCQIAYPADKKGTATVTIEPKKSVKPLGWELSGAVEGGKAVTLDKPEATIEASDINSSVSFTARPLYAPGDTDLIESAVVFAAEGEILPAQDGSFRIENLRPGDAAILTITPKDRDTYRLSETAVTILKPAEKEAPTEVWFGTSRNASGNFGMATVSFKPVALAQSRTLCVELLVAGKSVAKETVQAEYSSEFIGKDTQTQQVDLRAAMRSAGQGDFELRAYFAGGEYTSDSAGVSAAKTFGSSHFNIWEVETEGANPLPGGTLKVTAVRDAFGNDLLPEAAFQWWRGGTAGGKGTPVSKEDGGNGSSFTVPENSSGMFFGVEIGVKGISDIHFTQFSQVGYPPVTPAA